MANTHYPQMYVLSCNLQAYVFPPPPQMHILFVSIALMNVVSSFNTFCLMFVNLRTQ